jgi:hypothetical protein
VRRWDVAALVYTTMFVLLGMIASVQLWSLANLQRGLLEATEALDLYLPLRLARSREARGLRRLLAGSPDPLLVEHLARAALRRVPYSELRRLSDQPWREVEQGRHVPLAAAELRRLGLRPPAGWRADTAEPRGG